MDKLLARLLLSALEQNEEMKRSVTQFLRFYRENRELICLLTNASPSAQSAAPTAAAQDGSAEKGEQKRPPNESAVNITVLENYLNRAV